MSSTSPATSSLPAIPTATMLEPTAQAAEPMTQTKTASTTESGVVVRALHKSASMFLYRFFEQVSFDRKLDYFSINHSRPTENLVNNHIKNSFCVCPIRNFNTKKLVHFDHMDRVTQIFHIRDPRDMLVSEYFSFGWIHPEHNFNQTEKMRRAKLRTMSIDDYAINHPELAPNLSMRRFEPLLKWLDDKDDRCETVLVKYETMVTHFSKWVEAVIQPFGFRWPKLAVARYAWKYRHEFKTNGETLSHKRRIIPGDHKEKLQPKTIEILNRRYEEVLNRLGYDF